MHVHVALCALIALAPLVVTYAYECPEDRKQADSNEKRLQKDLLCSYQTDFRPVVNHTQAVNVKVRFALKYIAFDQQEEVFTIHSWVAMSWKDEFLSWTPSDYGNIEEIQLGSHEIWTPELALFNADASSYQSESFYTTCLVKKDGVVMCVPHLAHSGICSTRLRYWPYDTQKCTLYFGSWMHTGEQVNFTFYQEMPVILDEYQPGPGWKLLDVKNVRLPGNYSCCPNNTYPMLKYTFKLQREAAGPAAIVVVPSLVIVSMTLTSLLLDVKDNTRLVLACFSLFGHFIFLTEIGYDIPKHSADTPVVLLFLRDSMLVTLGAVILTLGLMALRRRTEPPPAWLKNIHLRITTGPARYVVFTEFDPADSKPLTENDLNEDSSRIRSDWMQVANVINSVIFLVTFLIYLILLFSYIL
ncbi:Acetylcholine receptor subunit alpha-like 2 [Eumeta japonica]|uniref:Acetylcholine receptor subunit alpha-like 2 n=1 Tax=Eumeta variegata TaxID=151549 RepID=A0A4C1U540_EUMVA|nr:Acetylcholine receptor subunit alpha-like 2 [Eumeta japonica]